MIRFEIKIKLLLLIKSLYQYNTPAPLPIFLTLIFLMKGCKYMKNGAQVLLIFMFVC